MARNRHEELFEEDESELNLTPYLDIITTLVIFMIFSFQVVIEFQLIDVLAPQIVGDGGGANQDNPPLTVALVIGPDEVRIRANDIPPTDISVPKSGDAYDFVTLRDRLAEFKSAALARSANIGDNVTISSRSDIPYATLVQVIDAVRVDKAGKTLFPAISLAPSYSPNDAMPGGGAPGAAPAAAGGAP
jgi:biopolymer transport protein ExbD